jgi:hypothetical protein
LYVNYISTEINGGELGIGIMEDAGWVFSQTTMFQDRLDPPDIYIPSVKALYQLYIIIYI